MDIATDLQAPVDTAAQTALSYDNSIPYEDQLPTASESNASLANRIGTTKVYLLSDASSKAVRLGKRKLANTEENNDTEIDGDQDVVEDEMEIDHDPTIRANAILLHGPPISHLPTARLFEYAAHFDVHPLGMEWIDDTTCIFVFSSKSAARSAFYALRKSGAPSPPPSADSTEFSTARSVPVSLWPPEDRIHQSLGVGQGLRGTMNIRWARIDDKKKKGAKRDSEFYKKHGLDAGKESAGFGVVPASVAASAGSGNIQDSLVRRLGPVGDTLEERISVTDDGEVQPHDETDGIREWDRGKPGVTSSSSLSMTLEKRISTNPTRKRQRGDIDEFLDDDLNDEDGVREEVDGRNRVASPPSKMRSDYIADDGRTVIGSVEQKIPELKDRIMAPLPRRAGRSRWEQQRDENRAPPRRRGRDRDSTSGPVRKKTRQELDDELDAFLNEA